MAEQNLGDQGKTQLSIGRRLAQGVAAGADWLAGRVDDIARWAVNLIRDLPVRSARLGLALWAGLRGPVAFVADELRLLKGPHPPNATALLVTAILRSLAWLFTSLSRLGDLIGLPEFTEVILRAISRATPLTPAEISAAASALGVDALRWGEIRVAEGGLLRFVFSRNTGRAFTVFHTVAMPAFGYSQRTNLPILVHELTHIYQHERVGSIYMGEAIVAQQTAGYDYGDAAGLRRACAAGKRYRDFNREQQAQIVQDYFSRCQSDEDVAAYEPFIAELRAGRV